MKKGAKADGLYVVLEGFLQAQAEPLKPLKASDPNVVLGVGDIFGDVSICLGIDEPARITAVTDGLVGFISLEELKEPQYDALYEFIEKRCIQKQKQSTKEKQSPVPSSVKSASQLKISLMKQQSYDYDTDEEHPAYRSSCNVFDFTWLVGGSSS
jgi:CRP-like cAMP-binding protein